MFTTIHYVVAFGGAALACFASLPRARRVEDTETRYGLVALLAGSGAWAAANVGLLVGPFEAFRSASYVVGLIVGLSTVGAWLYFCSAYTGRELHRDPRIRWLAVGVYALVTVVKLTNPIHGQYYATQMVADPFVHLAVRHQPLHWVVTGLSYSLSAVGFFMLFEEFTEAGYDTRYLAGIISLTGLPVAFDLVAAASDILVEINYEPIGVAAFAVGVLFVFEERFLAVQVTSGVDEAVVFLDEDGVIREFNEQALSVVPELAGSLGEPAESVDRLAGCLDEDRPVLETREDGETRYYLAGTTSFSVEQNDLGGIVMFTDITETERQRRELARHNQQLEDFAAGIRHELNNSLQVVSGRVEVAGAALDRGDVETARDSLGTASETADQMRDIVDDLSVVARYGKTAEEYGFVDIRRAVESAWNQHDSTETTLTIDGDGEVAADGARLEELFGSAFEFAAVTGTESVVVTVRDDGFSITYYGGPAVAETDEVFDYGDAVPHAEAGMALPKVRTLAQVHGWTCTVADSSAFALVVDDARVRQSGTNARPSVEAE
ncbi:histidine kinase N-terminal 7TM domain-containing protein [Halorientalis litorea]|uniref:histidine kinase N-terminal 7TM domain-containing protein n=1 Tax=Halorientalis litorea TaxID=2931977 RepID=UPI001FF5A0E1|nr:histidine kinase N-terminal 7TM domain-containing protein [Halorientalis litorea]